MHYRPPGRSARRIVPRQLETTLEVDDGIVRTGRARSIRRSGSAPPRALALLCGAFFMVLLDGTITILALTEGYRSAFLACAVLAGIGLALALLLPGRPPKAAHERPEPDPAADAAAAGDVVIRSGTK
jgi:hypothetical protein